MGEQFYSDARLYDRLFPGGEEAVDFYRAEPIGDNAGSESACRLVVAVKLVSQLGSKVD